MKRVVFAAVCAFVVIAIGCSDPIKESKNEVYKMCQEAAKSRLKVPGSARFPAFNGVDNDSVKIELSGSASDSAFVRGSFESQNMFGVFLSGNFTGMFHKEGDKWVEDIFSLD